MAEWIVFDDDNVKPLAARTHAQVHVGVGDPLEVMLASDAPAMAVYPGDDGKTYVLRVRSSGEEHRATREYVATGFLGLDDAAAEEEPTRRKWWKFWSRDMS